MLISYRPFHSFEQYKHQRDRMIRSLIFARSLGVLGRAARLQRRVKKLQDSYHDVKSNTTYAILISNWKCDVAYTVYYGIASSL